MSYRNTVIDTLKTLKEDFSFSGDLRYQNVGYSVNNILMPRRILPVRNPCYSMSILIAHLLRGQGIGSRICLARRESWKKLLPIHVLLFLDDEEHQGWYIDFIFDGQFAIHPHRPPDPSDVLLETWEYHGEDTLQDLLDRNASIYASLLRMKAIINGLLPRNWPVKRNSCRADQRASVLNMNKNYFPLPHFEVNSVRIDN